MGKLAKTDDELQDEATAAAIAAARSVAEGQPANTPAGRLSDQQWGWIITAAIFGWIQARYQQALSLEVSRKNSTSPAWTPRPVTARSCFRSCRSLADQSAIDWSKPVAEWSSEEMAGFVGLAWRLIDEAKAALEPDVRRDPAADRRMISRMTSLFRMPGRDMC